MRDSLEYSYIIESKIPSIVVGWVECHAMFAEYFPVGSQMQRFAVCEHTVEVEDNARKRHGSYG
jgi:hypothetical protein